MNAFLTSPTFDWIQELFGSGSGQGDEPECRNSGCNERNSTGLRNGWESVEDARNPIYKIEFFQCSSLREIPSLSGHNSVIVCTDSRFVIDAATKWLQKWRKNNWTAASGHEVKNRVSFEKLHAAITRMNNNVTWVRNELDNLNQHSCCTTRVQKTWRFACRSMCPHMPESRVTRRPTAWRSRERHIIMIDSIGSELVFPVLLRPTACSVKFKRL